MKAPIPRAIDRPPRPSIALSRPRRPFPHVGGDRTFVVATAALTILAALAAFAALRISRPVMLPILGAILAHFTFVPIVQGLRRVGVPRPLGATAVVLVLVAAAAAGLYLVREPAVRWADELPASVEAIERKLVSVKRSVEDMSRATEQVEQIAAVEDGKPVVTVKEPGLRDTLVTGATETAGSLVVGLVLIFFLLARDDLLLRKIVVLAPTLTEKRIAVVSVRAVQREVSRYLLTIGTINVALGVVIGLAMWAAGMPNPLLWGVVGGLLNFVPYLGAACGAVIVGVVGLVTFDTLEAAIVPPLLYALITGLEGMVITPFVLGYRLQLSPAIVFAWLVLWGWLWGVPGALIAVPLLVSIKIACDNVESLRPVGRLLGRA